jgi:hypothetical protein
LTEIRTRHSLLVKNKTFKEKQRLKTNNGGKMMAADRDTVMIQDESDEDNVALNAIPAAGDDIDEDDDAADNVVDEDDDDKKKLGFRTTYDGFSIWGWVLCLFVERKGGPGKKTTTGDGNAQALMQDWIASTQKAQDDD